MQGIEAQTQEKQMRSTSLVVAVSLLVSAAAPALAAAKHAQARAQANDVEVGYDACEALAVRRGSPPGQGGSTYTETQFRAFMQQCLAGKIPFAEPPRSE
jgi:hypothetical protein